MDINFNSPRHKEYKDFQDMYDAHTDTHMIVRKIGDYVDHPYLELGLSREVALLYSDLAFGNPINAFTKTTDSDTIIEDLIDDNKLNQLLSEASITQAIKGGIVLKNYLDNGKSKITFIEPDYYFPTFSPFDKRKILSETIAIPYEENEDTFLYTETYEPDETGLYWCITAHYQYKDNKVGKKLNESKVSTTIFESPLEYVPFIRSGSDFWGDSIYKGSVALYDELNNRVTQISNVLDKHSDPSMWALSSVFDENNQLNHKGGKVYEVQEDVEGKKIGDAPIGYITWDWNPEANFKFIKDIIMKILYTVSPLTPALYGLDESSQSTGRALVLKSWRTQCKVFRSYIYWRPALQSILFKAQQLQVNSGELSYAPEMPSIELSLNIPMDFFEMAQAEQLKVTSKTTSRKSAISRLNPHYSSREVDDEFADMIAEEAEINNLTFMTDFGSNNGG
ncbi:phage portal protein [Neobacillus mesonae]|uniref:phage portal protein n=1 Tax=Neobacillus mesonae TaxID=1193713 RepID=UPI002573CA85|nr:phage portal protein [Neobacillus mesonae]